MSGRVEVAVDFPSAAPLHTKPARVEVVQRTFRHDIVVLTYFAAGGWWKKRFESGSPVIVTWGHMPNDFEHFFGKVLYAHPHLENEQHTLRVVCIGASQRLRTVDPMTFAGLSIEQSVALSLRRMGFNLVIDRSSHSWPTLTRTVHETMFEYLVRVARRAGHTFYINKTTVCMYNPVDVLLANQRSYPVFTYANGRGNKFGSLITFTAKLADAGAGDMDDGEQRSVGVDPRTGQAIGMQDSGERLRRLNSVRHIPEFAVYDDYPVHNTAEAAAISSGRKRDARWTMRATAHVYGNVRVTQGSGVIVRGVSAQDDGLWFVDQARHEITSEDHPQQWRYFASLDLLRDSRQQDTQIVVGDRPQRTIVSVVDLRSSRQPELPRLVGNEWVAPHARTTVIAA